MIVTTSKDVYSQVIEGVDCDVIDITVKATTANEGDTLVEVWERETRLEAERNNVFHRFNALRSENLTYRIRYAREVKPNAIAH